MKIVIVSPKNRTVYNFRGELLEKIVSLGHEVIVTGPDETDIDKIQQLGVRFATIPFNKNGINILSDLRYMLALLRLFRKEKPEITFGYTIKPVIYGAIAARLAGVANRCSMVTGAGYIFTGKTIKAKLIKLLACFLYCIGFKCTDTVIFQNCDDANEFVEHKLLSRKKCRIVNGSGVNLQRFSLAPLPDRITFLMLSRVMYSKGIREYLQAAEEVKTKYPQARFMLLGAIENTPDSMTMEELSPYLNRDIIEYFGETEDVVNFYRQCSVYVLPSYREGTPRTVLEAMAMGRPIITTDVPGCRETVQNGQNGFLVPDKNSCLLAEKMIWFIENKDQINKMGQASYDLCRDKFDVQRVNDEMLKYLNIF